MRVTDARKAVDRHRYIERDDTQMIMIMVGDVRMHMHPHKEEMDIKSKS